MHHPIPLDSLSAVRGKVYGNTLDQQEMSQIITDVVAGRYADVHLSSFITACSARSLDHAEIVALTRAMVEAGERLTWPVVPIADKHCVGGLPGNRTTPIIVPIVAAYGLTIPKTSSRAITSPAGTADTMETLAPVDLDIATMRRVVEREGGCVVWGGAMGLSPADDILIRVERALDLDPEGQMIASVLSKKIAAGSTDVVIDIPIGPTAKVRSKPEAQTLTDGLMAVSEQFGLRTRIVWSDGSQPVGRGIGPALEARDVLAVLRGDAEAPRDLREKALSLAAPLLELSARLPAGEARATATAILDDGRAWVKFQAICEAQGGMREPPGPAHTRPILASHRGRVTEIDNRRLAKVAKLAGAPDDKAAGIELHVRLDDPVEPGMPLYTIHAEAPGELDYALDHVADSPDIIRVTRP